MQFTELSSNLSKTVGNRLRNILQCGLTPHKLALTICLGTAVGVLPLFWGSTLLCAALAFSFGLNQTGIQAVNYLAYPLQLALFLPFCRLGEKLFPWGPAVSTEVLTAALHGHLSATITLIGWAILKAITAWLITAPPAAVLLYLLLKAIIKRKYPAPVDHSEHHPMPTGR